MRRYGTDLVTRPAVLCGLLAAATVVFAALEVAAFPGLMTSRTMIVTTGASLASCACVLVMRRLPWLVMGTSLVSLSVSDLWSNSSPIAYILLAVGCCSVASWGSHPQVTVPLAGVVTLITAVADPDVDGILVVYSVVLPVLVGSLSVAIGLAAKQQQQIMAQLRSQHEQLTLLQQRETQAAVVTERTRIARELHDVVAHHLSALLIQAHAGQRLAGRSGAPEAERWGSVTDVARETLQSMRRMVGLLRTAEDDDLGVPDRRRDPQPRLTDLDDLVRTMRRSGLVVQIHVPDGLDDLPADVHLAAYRVVQEAVTNVLRHASATRVVVRITADSSALVLNIGDDGEVGAAFRPGNGLIGMRERVASFGGRLDLRAEPGRGLRIRAWIPFASALDLSPQGLSPQGLSAQGLSAQGSVVAR